MFAANGETPLHVVAADWDVALAEELVTRGADISRRRADGRTPYAVAELNGNARSPPGCSHTARPATFRARTGWSRRAAAAIELPRKRCSRRTRGSATRSDPSTTPRSIARRNETTSKALEALLACGFDPDRGDESIGKTALHIAAMEGWPDAARVLLAHGASMDVRDREFKGQPLVWAAEGSRTARPGSGPRSRGPSAARRRFAGRLARN